jgi:ATP synthase F1 epsilon subunit
MRLKICILIPDRIYHNEIVEEIVRKTMTGQIGILQGHAPLITIIEIGPIIFRRETGWASAALIGGFALIKNDCVTILVNSAEIACSIDPAEVEKSFEIATNRLNRAVEADDKIRAANIFRRERARYKAINRRN